MHRPSRLAFAVCFVIATCLATACGDDDLEPTPADDAGLVSSSTSSGSSPTTSSGATGSSGTGTTSSGAIDASTDASADDASTEDDSGSPDPGPEDAGSTEDAGPDGGALGAAIEAPALTWTWVDFPESRCRNGSSTGIGVNLNPASDKVMIYLQGGGACFNVLSCLNNPASFGPNNLGSPSNGIFDRTDAQNAVKDYSMVFVPYCTGDVHAGDAPNTNVSGVIGAQQFVGYTNLTAYLHRLVPTFATATEVLLTGESAGGFGAAANFEHVQRAFGDVPVALIDDSGPPLDGSVADPCLQRQWRERWGLERTLLADCGAACDDPNDYLSDVVDSIRARYPNLKAGLVSSTKDDTIRLFFGFGANSCQGVPGTSEASFLQGLRTFRTRVQTPGPGFGTFYIDSQQHTWLRSRYLETVDGVQLRSWVSNVLAGGPTQHLGAN